MKIDPQLIQAMVAFAAFIGSLYLIITKPLLSKFDDVRDRFNDISKRFDAVDKRFDAVDKRLDAIEKLLQGHDQRITRLEERSPLIKRS